MRLVQVAVFAQQNKIVRAFLYFSGHVMNMYIFLCPTHGAAIPISLVYMGVFSFFCGVRNLPAALKTIPVLSVFGANIVAKFSDFQGSFAPRACFCHIEYLPLIKVISQQ
jgi:hypothetical protein